MTQPQWSIPLPLAIGTHVTHRTHLSLHRADDPARAQVEQFIHQRFAHVHQADVQHYLPELLALRDSNGRLVAAAGMRLACEGALYLERYLDVPIERAVAQVCGNETERMRLVEVGNLASLSAGSARVMIIAVTWLLGVRGLQWVAFTGATTLINSFQRLGLKPNVLAVADPDRVQEQLDQWGTYYNLKPQVYAGDIGFGFSALERAGVFQRLGFPSLLQVNGHAA